MNIKNKYNKYVKDHTTIINGKKVVLDNHTFYALQQLQNLSKVLDYDLVIDIKFDFKNN